MLQFRVGIQMYPLLCRILVAKNLCVIWIWTVVPHGIHLDNGRLDAISRSLQYKITCPHICLRNRIDNHLTYQAFSLASVTISPKVVETRLTPPITMISI